MADDQNDTKGVLGPEGGTNGRRPKGKSKSTVPIGTARCVTAQNKPDNNNLRLKKLNNEPYFVYI